MKKKIQLASEKIDQLIESILLSPSSHNTQPWLLSIEENTFYFFVDSSRRLKVADPTNRELYISIGCAIANALISASKLDFQTDLELFPDKKNELYVAKITLSEKEQKNRDYSLLAEMIPRRLSNRFEYDPNQPIPKEFSIYSQNEAKKFQLEFSLVEDSEEKTLLAVLTKEAIFKAISRKEFRQELTHWIRHNWTKKSDGMPGYAIGLPSIPSILFPALIHSPSMPKNISEGEYKMIIDSSGVGIISIDKDNRENWVNAGIYLEHIWLKATELSLGMSLLSGAVEMEEERVKVQKIIKSIGKPTVFFRVGYPLKPTRPSPRRLKTDVVRTMAQVQHLLQP